MSVDRPELGTNGDDHAPDEEDELSEISVEVDEEGMVWLRTGDWELVLYPEDARELGKALIDAADDAGEPEEPAGAAEPAK
jgi:hypothetical protein